MLKRFHNNLGLSRIVGGGFAREKTTKGFFASFYTSCAIAPGFYSSLFLLLLLALPTIVHAQTSTSPSSTVGSPNTTSNTPDAQNPSGTTDPLSRPLSDKEKFKQQKDLRNELKGPYKKWVDEDVRWIITDQELKAFKSLSNDEERDNFIENFWQRRNPDPNSPENEYREENYRRIAYANEHFAAGKPGWKTDRGHMYIAYGKPDSIDSHPSGGNYQRPMDEGGGETSTFPFEIWHYRYIEGIGENIDIEFVDTCMCGDYHMTLDRSEKDALLHVPGAGATMAEQMGTAKRTDRCNGGLECLGGGPMANANQGKEFDRLEQFSKLQAPPVVKFKDLESFLVNHKVLSGPFFPFEVRTDYVKVTEDTVLVPLTLQIRNRDITFNTKDGVAKGQVNVLGRVATITDHVVQTFEQTLEVEEPSELLGKALDQASVHWWALPLKPGRYRVDIAIKDVNNPDHIGTWAEGIVVPKYDDEKLSASSLILADKMEQVPTKQIGTGQFILGNTYVRPRVSAGPAVAVTFHRDQKLNFWMQIYNLAIDDKSKQNAATIQYQIMDMASNKAILDTSESSSALGDNSANSDQLTVRRSLPLESLQPGKYQVTITVNDHVSKQQVAQSAPFTVD
jgi:GWxTD domain-containing protein